MKWEQSFKRPSCVIAGHRWCLYALYKCGDFSRVTVTTLTWMRKSCFYKISSKSYEFWANEPRYVKRNLVRGWGGCLMSRWSSPRVVKENIVFICQASRSPVDLYSKKRKTVSATLRWNDSVLQKQIDQWKRFGGSGAFSRHPCLKDHTHTQL